MSRAFAYSPDYRLWIKKSDGSTWSLRSLQSVQSSLFVRDGVGQMSVTLADPSGKIRDEMQPHAMNLVQLQLKNPYGQWATAWTGYVDEAHRTFDGQRGEQVHLSCTSPYKLFEITRLTPSQTASLALAYMTNITGSAVVRYACQACGFPLGPDSSGNPCVSFGVDVDSGSGIQTNISTATFTNPDSQTWSAVLQQLVANSGVECFTGESGHLFWRQAAYLSVPSSPRTIEPYDIIGSDFFESDQDVVTRVEVRWGVMPFHQNAAFWQAPSSMVTHLRQRSLVVYAPWLQNQSAASWLAQMLGQQLASGILQAQVTIPADPYFTIGTTVKVALPNNPYLVQGLLSAPPPKRGTDYALYYVSSIAYQLEWGGQWTMTLGLSYGRNANASFPYVGKTTYPVLSSREGVPYNNTITTLAFDPNFPARVSTPFTLQAQSGLDNTHVTSSSIPPGTVITLNAPLSGTQSGGSSLGPPAGPSHNGEYTVTGAPAGQAPNVLGISPGAWVTSTPSVYASIRLDSQNADDASGDGSGDTFSVSGSTASPRNMGSGQAVVSSTPPPASDRLAIKALGVAYKLIGQTFAFGQAGPNAWDCSGLVAWSYYKCGLSALIGIGNGPNGTNTDVGPQGIYNYFYAQGASPISVDQAQPGDLLFTQFNHTTGTSYIDNQHGFAHVAFCLTAGGLQNGTALQGWWTDVGIVVYAMSAPQEMGAVFNLALSMQNIVLSS